MRGKPCFTLVLALVAGCDGPGPDVPVIEVTARDHAVTVQGRGELVAGKSIPISLPADVNMSFTISWLAPEFSHVEAGDVVARFDESDVADEREESLLALTNTEFQLRSHQRSADISQSEIIGESQRVAGEVDIARNFVDVDPMLFSRIELIDRMGDLDYLDVEGEYYDWQLETHTRRTDAERREIIAGRRTSELQLEQQNAALDMMELRTPATGTFVHARTPWGRKLTEGERVYAGRPVGFLPVEGEIRARIYVPEPDAIGLAVGQDVSIQLDTAVGQHYAATISSVSPVASPRDADDPQKYFIVEAGFETFDPEHMRVGGSLDAAIVTVRMENALLLPSQTVHFEADGAHVFVMEGRDLVKRPVTPGRRSRNLVEIVDGLSEGESVSLVAPGGGA